MPCRDDFRPEQGLLPSDFVAQGVLCHGSGEEEVAVGGSLAAVAGYGGAALIPEDTVCRLFPDQTIHEDARA